MSWATLGSSPGLTALSCLFTHSLAVRLASSSPVQECTSESLQAEAQATVRRV